MIILVCLTSQNTILDQPKFLVSRIGRPRINQLFHRFSRLICNIYFRLKLAFGYETANPKNVAHFLYGQK